MHIEALLAMLKQLKLYGMRQSVQDLSLQNAPAWQQAQPMLETLLKAEVADREVRSVAYQMSAARFPAYRDLYGFNFAESEVDERLVQDLHRCELIQSSQNLVFVGGPGTGKTHLATAIGVQAIQHHQLRVRFISTLELVNALELDYCSTLIDKTRSFIYVRAFDHKTGEFRSFKLNRVISSKSSDIDVKPNQTRSFDKDWNDEVEIIIGINGSHQNADAIVFDNGMENEKITVRLKKALVFFFLADWNIAPLEYPHLPETLFPLKVIEVKEIE